MKKVHVLKTALAAPDCRPLLAAAAELGVRVGWLELEGAAPAPGELEAAAAAGVFRAVSVSADRVVTTKPVRGPAVFTDLLREHFAGCRAVLVQGALAAPELVQSGPGYAVRFEDGAEKTFTAEALARALRRPRLRGQVRPSS